MKAIKAELNLLGEFIKSNPHFLYDTSKRASTGWRNMRQFVTNIGGKLGLGRRRR